MSTADEIRLVVSVGTYHRGFDRLVEWVDAWADGISGTVGGLAQLGPCRPSRHLTSTPYLNPSELIEAMAEADAVVCQAGPGTLLDARRAGIEPIVVPRTPERGEIVDAHQEQFAAWMAQNHGLAVATTREELARLLDRLVTDRQAFRRSSAAGDDGQAAHLLGELVEEMLG